MFRNLEHVLDISKFVIQLKAKLWKEEVITQ